MTVIKAYSRLGKGLYHDSKNWSVVDALLIVLMCIYLLLDEMGGLTHQMDQMLRMYSIK